MNIRMYLKLFTSLRMKPKDGHIFFKDERLIITPPDTYSKLYERLTEIIGKGGAASTLYMGAKESSVSVYRLMINIFSEDFVRSEKTFAKSLDDTMTIAGYGKPEVLKVDFSKPEVIIRVRGFITSSGVTNSDVPVCQIERGVLTGVVECITKRPCHGKEVKCQAMGDDYCEFIITGKEDD